MNNKVDTLINVGVKEGDEIFFKILEEYPELDENDPRQAAVLLSIMTNCIIQLHARGWTERDLINEVFDHCEIARDIMDDTE